MSHTVGPVPNELTGMWDGTGDRILERTIEVEDDSRAQDEDWCHVCAPGADPVKALEMLKQLGYTDPHE